MNTKRCPGCYEPFGTTEESSSERSIPISERYCSSCKELKIVKESWSPITPAGRIAGVYVQPSKRPWAR